MNLYRFDLKTHGYGLVLEVYAESEGEARRRVRDLPDVYEMGELWYLDRPLDADGRVYARVFLYPDELATCDLQWVEEDQEVPNP